jgi:hypothetical protein
MCARTWKSDFFLDGLHRIDDGALGEFVSKFSQYQGRQIQSGSPTPNLTLVQGIRPHVFHQRPRHIDAPGLLVFDVHIRRLQKNADHLAGAQIRAGSGVKDIGERK